MSGPGERCFLWTAYAISVLLASTSLSQQHQTYCFPCFVLTKVDGEVLTMFELLNS